MAGTFDSKYFNAEVFGKYVSTIPNLKLNELIKSKAIRNRPELAGAMSDQVGGNYISTPLRGLIGGTPLNYDGETNITATSTVTYMHSRVVVGRAKAWEELDFSFDITGGTDFMQNAANQVSEYWQEVDQDTIVSILKGIFNMTGAKNLEFVNQHTLDITGAANAADKVMGPATLNTAIQKASGDNKSKFTLIIMHSAVATNLENLQLIQYMKGTDGNGIQRDLALATLNGKLVIIDDSMPVATTTTSAGTQGVYTVQISTALGAGDKINIAGVEYAYDSSVTTAANQVIALHTLLTADPDVTSMYTVTKNSTTLTFTEKSGQYGVGAPVVDETNLTTGAVTKATTTAGVAPTYAYSYTSYVLGDGAIEYTDCGVKVPYEMDRNPATNGGKDILYTRQRKCFAPYGISFTKDVMSSASPENEELENGANWELVSSPVKNGTKEYINHKAIPIARIISLG